MSYRYVPGYGSSSADLVVCGEAPGKQEEEDGKPFVGPTGQETRSMLRLAGIAPEACFFTNVFPYRPPGNDIRRAAETGHTIEECIPDLWTTLKAIRSQGGAKCILALGNLALQVLTGENGIKKWRGSILPCLYTGGKVVPSIHPANLFERRGKKGMFPYSAKVYIQMDFNRAVEESLTEELELPKRNLSFAKRSLDLYDYLGRHEGEKRAALDIEAYHCVPSMISIAFSRHESLSVPLVPLPGLVIPTFDLAEIWRMIDKFLRDKTMEFIGQNWKYDDEKLSCIGFRMWKLFCDTMLLQKTVNPEFPGALEFITSTYTREPYYKDEYRTFDPSKDSIEKILIYNARDSAVTFECFEELMKDLEEIPGLKDFFFNFVMKLHPIYQEMEEIGLKTDFDVRNKLYAKYTDLQLAEEDKLFKILGHPINCNSHPQVKFLLWEELRIPRRAKVDEDTLVALLMNVVKKDEKRAVLNHIINVRRIRNAKSKIASRVDYDGRMRTSYRLVGTEAGRSSTAILKKPVRMHEMGMSFHSITKHGDLGGDIRTMFVPTFPGWVFMNADLAQAETRVVAELSQDEELLRWFREGVDVHARTSAFIFGGDEVQYQKPAPERHIGKIGRHAYAYGTTARRLMLEANTQARRFNIDVQISQWRAGKVLEIMDEKCPKIQEVYWPAIRAAAHSDRILKTAGGRVRQFLNRLNDDLYREMYSYIPQADVSDQTKRAMIKAKEKFPLLRIVIEAHDAFVVEGERNMIEQEVAPYVKEVMEEPIDFSGCTISRGLLSIPCDIEVGDNYKDLKKLKVT